MTRLHAFLVEDEDSLRISLADDLRDAGYRIDAFSSAVAAYDVFQSEQPDVIITDIKMPGMSGIDFLEKVKAVAPGTEVIVITAHGSVASAVEAMKLGAYDYLTKPFESDELLLAMRRIEELVRLRVTNRLWHEQSRSNAGFDTFIGESEISRALLQQVQVVAGSQSTVLIQGETGTGKELIANLVHYGSARSNHPLVKVSAAVLSREMFESELFGHEKGAFTGAVKAKPGRFELADGGTLYLDDVDDIPLDLQVKLLRVIEEREFERVGGSDTIQTDVRIIASTKVDLRRRVDEGGFREDLYFRLNVFPLFLHPLRDRIEDIRPLVDYWLQQFSSGRKLVVHEEVYDILDAYRWRGNVRELRNLMERLCLVARSGVVDASMLPVEILSGAEHDASPTGPIDLERMLAETEIRMITALLKKCGGNRTQTARHLGIPPSTLRTKMEKYGIQ
ncbi:MAG: sigma-54-dependent Fis family transcriptional regulator [Bacteroidetes bacterium]|nr:sigma-54-dependent Fis family transcriptional regulator [Bacteroidota bacterium]